MGPQPLLCPQCLGRACCPPAPPSTPSLSHHWAVGGGGCQGKGTPSSPRKMGPPPSTPTSALGRGPPRCRAQPGTHTAKVLGELGWSSVPAPWTCRTPTPVAKPPWTGTGGVWGGGEGVPWGAGGGSPHPWPCMPWPGAELLSQAGAGPGARPPLLHKVPALLWSAGSPALPLGPAVSSPSPTGHRGPPALWPAPVVISLCRLPLATATLPHAPCPWWGRSQSRALPGGPQAPPERCRGSPATSEAL